jgi:hypothetical protein
MTTVLTTTNSEVTTPASYVSRWIAQSHGTYQKKGDNNYYSSSCDCRTSTTSSITKQSTQMNSNHNHITTWQAQAMSRMNTVAMTTDSSLNTQTPVNNNDLQEKLNHVR